MCTDKSCGFSCCFDFFIFIENQCCQVKIFKNRQFALWNSPKSPIVEPKIAEKSPHFVHILANFCPGWPFLMHFYVTMFSKIQICKKFLLLSQQNFSKIEFLDQEDQKCENHNYKKLQYESLKKLKKLWFSKCQKGLKNRRNCQYFTWNRGKIAKNC